MMKTIEYETIVSLKIPQSLLVIFSVDGYLGL